MNESSQDGATVGKPSEPTDQDVAKVLHFKGAVITLAGTAIDVEETWRRILDCPEWCVRDHLNERYSEDIELHQGATRWVPDAKTADGEKLGVLLERDKEHGDGSGGLAVLIHGSDRGHFVDMEPTGALRLAIAMIDAAAALGAVGRS